MDDNNKQTNKPQISPMAMAAFILGICSLIIPYFDFVCAVLAIVFGALKRDEQFGKIGMILGIIGIAVSILLTVLLQMIVFR